MLKPEFKTIEARKLVGMQITTNLQDDNSTAFFMARIYAYQI
jgi:hypothetical protein